MAGQPRILCFSRDVRLAQTRKQVLEMRYEAVCVTSVEEMEALHAPEGFDVVIFCHSLDVTDCERGLDVSRERWPEAKIVVLASNVGECAAMKSDKVVRSVDGPAALLHSVAMLL